MFIGRNSELEFLDNYYSRVGSQIVVVYGQRGVGKTTLLKQFSENKKTTYYLAGSCSAREQRYQWGCEQRAQGADTSVYPEYEELFRNALGGELHQKNILIIDEFHHLVKGDSGFMAEAIRFLNSLENGQGVMLVLCTSASGWVENSMIKKMGSSAQAISGLLKVREMKFAQMQMMFPGYTGADYVDIYAILGGIPGLWKSFTPDYSAKENMIRNLLFKESRLYGEMWMIMAEELREPAVYNTILAAMARGLNKLNDIYKHTGFSRAKISVYLKNLMELDLVEKVYSYEMGDEGDTQKGIYRISNPYVRFYFRFLFPNLSMLEALEPREFYKKCVAEDFSAFAERAYGKICREVIGETSEIVGEWLGKAGSLDVVASDSEGNITVANCYYSNYVDGTAYEALVRCAKKAGLKDATHVLYGESGFSEEVRALAMEGKVELRYIL